MTMRLGSKYLIGIDEAGRGPLAGPVAVGVALVSANFDWSTIPGVGDSKQIKEKDREAIFCQAQLLKRGGHLDFAVSLVSAAVIDRKGIVAAVTLAMERSLQKLKLPADAALIAVKLDGGLKAPASFPDQETIIKGDAKEKIIGLASIMAKVTRDKYMKRRAKLSPYKYYGFDIHKGYGTKYHRQLILKYGLSTEHRCSFCKNVISVVE